jgi:hypothetical protein
VVPYFGLIVLVVWAIALIDVVVAEEYRVRHLPKIAWLIIVILLPLVGSLVWFLVGRPEGAAAPARTTGYPEYERPSRSAPSNPDDDEEFLRSIRERAEEQRRKGRELRDKQDPDGASSED